MNRTFQCVHYLLRNAVDDRHIEFVRSLLFQVVWNEVNFSERKNFKAMEEKIKLTFDSLAQLSHPNIVKVSRFLHLFFAQFQCL